MARSGRGVCRLPRLYVDLPGHGGSAAISVDGLMMSPTYCVKPWLVTTSLTSAGGVLAWWTGGDDGGLPGAAGLCGVIVEGGHPGLQNAEQVRNVSVPIANGCSVFSQNRYGGICRLVSTACFCLTQ